MTTENVPEESDADPEERYVHRPSGEPPRKLDADDEAFGWRGWVLVGMLIVAFLVVPWSLILLPGARGSLGLLGLTWRDTYLVVPLLPAVLLGLAGVWTALRSRQ